MGSKELNTMEPYATANDPRLPPGHPFTMKDDCPWVDLHTDWEYRYSHQSRKTALLAVHWARAAEAHMADGLDFGTACKRGFREAADGRDHNLLDAIYAHDMLVKYWAFANLGPTRLSYSGYFG